MKTVDRDHVRSVLENDADVAIVETSPKAAYRQEHLPTARHLPPESIRERATQVLPDRERPVIVYCASPDCGLSRRTARLLERMGYSDVRDYHGGKSDWRQAGYWFESETPAAGRAG